MTPTDAMVDAALDAWLASAGNRTGFLAPLHPTDMRAALTAALAVSGYGEVVEALREAERQIEYLHEKFMATGSGNAVLARIDYALSLIPTEHQS